MRRFLTIAFLTSLLAGAEAGDAPPATPAPLDRVQTIALPGVTGRLDQLTLDAKRKRLFVAAFENGSLEVVYLDKAERTKTVAGLDGPAGVAYVPDGDRLVVACRDGSVRFFDGETLEPAGRTDLGPGADNVRYDAVTQRLFVGFGEGALAAISPKKRLAVGKADLGAHPESFQLETLGRRAFVNVEAAAEVAVVDRFTMEVKARWKLGGARGNFPMALDETGRRLFVGCRTPPSLVVLSTDDGKAVARTECSPDADDVFLDAPRRRVYVCCGEGTVDVFERPEGDQVKLLARVATRRGARTALFDAASDRLFVAVPKNGDQDAEVRVFAPR